MKFKKLLLGLFCLPLLATAQQRVCPSHDLLHQQELVNPDMKQTRETLERFTENFVAHQTGATRATYNIPVVVHVLWNTAVQNISDAQIQSQIDALNADYQALNADKANTPSVFASLIANPDVQFCLAQQNPSGVATTGIVRKQTTKTVFDAATDDAKYTANQGDNIWDRNKYLNLWVVPSLKSGSTTGILGYAQFPGGAAATDGVVIGHQYFGTTGTAASPFNKGRTATHEVGHWLNLNHIWGDDGTACTGTDNVADTPNQGGENYGCPTFPVISCSNGPNGALFMNYMDYTDDACMFMFTTGQKNRMVAALTGSRASLLTSTGCNPGGAATCAVPTGLTSASLTTSGATVSWGAATGAVSYTLQYKTSTATTWTSVTGITTTSKALTGLMATTTYNFQVQTVCSAGSSAFSTAASFTTNTATVACAVPTSLVSSAITTSGATLGWAAVPGAVSYKLQYKKTANTSWTTITGITTNTYALTGLVGATSYDFKVATVCTTTSAYSTAVSFTTSTPVVCSDIYESNNGLSSAKAITVGTTISAAIGTSTDLDYFSFSNTAAKPKIKITLTSALDYDIRLYNSAGTQLVFQTTASNPEVLIYNTTTVGTYKFRIEGYNGAYSASDCYTVLVETSAANFKGMANNNMNDEIAELNDADVSIFPNPTTGELNIVTTEGKVNREAQVLLFNSIGQRVHQQTYGEDQRLTLHLNDFQNGVYILQVRTENGVVSKKVVLEQ
ncbi:MAG: hypothetical protein RLZZ292_1310 [Bacteroidota bacterium]|jgi:hypothetical protein